MRKSPGLGWPMLLLLAFVAGALLPTIFLTAAGQAHIDRYLTSSPNAAAWVQAIMGGLAVIAAVAAAWSSWRSSIFIARRNTIPSLHFEGFHHVPNQTFRLKLRNDGLGPVELTHVDVTVDGKPPKTQPNGFWLDVIRQLGLRFGVGGGIQLYKGQWIPAQNAIDVITIDQLLASEQDFEERIRRLAIDVTGRSLYGDEVFATWKAVKVEENAGG